ncbi:MAG: 30S ribosomal protein S9 [Saprospiraceae bacterium]|uniref:30S ribosomal protein S9 n=1 Tax=Candidatus Opimibacter skivensis TaxID=2982028 RepID=A0A9D7XPE8_9BACT|nr:30S ribosomal protein S9 [Candidatus Opimibacter skivensis]
MDTINAIGRRKASVARVYVSNGTGNIKVNGREYKEYFPLLHISAHVIAPLLELNALTTYDIKVNVSGGGYRGQSEAIRLAIARALTKINADYRPLLKIKKFLTRDARVVERKKFGKPKARKSFQFSKR